MGGLFNALAQNGNGYGRSGLQLEAVYSAQQSEISEIECQWT